MKATIKLEMIKVSQPIGDIFVTKINPSKLLSMSVTDRRRIEEDEEILGIQRELKKDKVVQIKSYLTSIDATFPNSIIVNTTTEFVTEVTDTTIELIIDENTFTIIDGQHRVEGFRGNDHDNFELIVAIFKDLKTDQQANIFSTINSEQTKVDPSLNLNLELNSKVLTPKKMMIEQAQSFNYDRESPWYNSIKMLGSQSDGIISLSAFVKPLLELTYPENEYYKIRNELMLNQSEFPSFQNLNYRIEKYIFWEFYRRKDFSSIYKILFNYFKALQFILDKDWLKQESLLNKTTGYNAIIHLFKEIVKDGLEKGDLSEDYFLKVLKPLGKFNGTLNSNNYGASGVQASNRLYYEMKSSLNIASAVANSSKANGKPS